MGRGEFRWLRQTAVLLCRQSLESLDAVRGAVGIRAVMGASYDQTRIGSGDHAGVSSGSRGRISATGASRLGCALLAQCSLQVRAGGGPADSRGCTVRLQLALGDGDGVFPRGDCLGA